MTIFTYFNKAKNKVYLVLEYAANGNLFSYSRKRKKLDETEVRKLFLQVCEAIEYMHKKGLLHRDLKPENILLDESNNVKLCDFGWSAQKSKTRMTFCGTYEYMAPEIFAHKRYNEKIDIWSLGILLYELLHGYSPYRGDSAIHIYKNILKNECKFKSGIDDSAKDLISKILRIKPAERLSLCDIIGHNYFALKYERPKSRPRSPDFMAFKAKFKKNNPQFKSIFKINISESGNNNADDENNKKHQYKVSGIKPPTPKQIVKDKEYGELTARIRKGSMASISDTLKTAKRSNSKVPKQNTAIDFFGKIASPTHKKSNDLRSKTKNLSLSINKNFITSQTPLNPKYITPFKKNNIDKPEYFFKLASGQKKKYYEILNKSRKETSTTKEDNVSKKLNIRTAKHVKNILSLATKSPKRNESVSIQSLKQFVDSHKKKNSLNSNGSKDFKKKYFDKLKLEYSPDNKENCHLFAAKNLKIEVDNPYYGPFYSNN